MNSLLRIDPKSFWIGFLLATLVWWLLGRLRPLIPALRDWLKRFFHTLRERDLYGANEYLRKDTLRRAQRAHLAADLFPLDAVLIPPQLLSPPMAIQPDAPPLTEAQAERVVPYLPDWPELVSAYAYPRMSLAKALSGGASIAVIGLPGSGKTVALAHLACQIARRETSVGPLMDFAPVFCHVLDLDLIGEATRDPLRPLLQLALHRAPVFLQSRLRRLLNERFREGRALLVLDGLDELPPNGYPVVLVWLKSLLAQYPATRIALAAAENWLDGLVDLGLAPVALAAWNQTEREQLVKRWSQAWSAEIAPQLKKATRQEEIDPALIELWLQPSSPFTTPLEWTLRVWGAFAGDLRGGGNLNALWAYLHRYVSPRVTQPLLEALARQYIHLQQAAIPYKELDQALSQQAGQPVTPSGAQPAREGKRTHRKDLILSVGEQALEELVGAGLLFEHPNQAVRFANPVFAGMLAALQLTQEDLQHATATPQWPLNQQALHYLAAQSDEASWIDGFIFFDPSPFNLKLQIACRWLKDAPPSSTWKPQLFRAMLGLVEDETQPEGLRARAIAGFSASNDATLPRLYRQLFSSASPVARKLAALGAGALGDPGLVPDLSALMADSQEGVRLAGCMALVATGSDVALNVVAQTLVSGDELLRQVAAEAVALIPEVGVASIQEASQVTDILTRRAAVFGLLQIGDPWATHQLEKIAVEDGQWVVRNAAAQALETLQAPDQHVPKPQLRPWNLPWLIAFASKHGQGVTPDQPANDLVHQALVGGTLDEQLAALELARRVCDNQIILDTYALLYSGHGPVSEAALLTLWYWVVQGMRLPAPHA